MAKWQKVLSKTSPGKLTRPYILLEFVRVRPNFANVTIHGNFNDQLINHKCVSFHSLSF